MVIECELNGSIKLSVAYHDGLDPNVICELPLYSIPITAKNSCAALVAKASIGRKHFWTVNFTLALRANPAPRGFP